MSREVATAFGEMPGVSANWGECRKRNTGESQ